MNEGERARRRSGVVVVIVVVAAVGVAGLAAALIGGLSRPSALLHAYLLAFVVWVAVPLGSITLLAVHHLSSGRWGRGVLRPARAAIRTLPLLALAFVPLALGLRHLYAWARPEALAASAVLRWKARYLNAPFFIGRAAAAFLLWIVLGFLLQRWSRQAEARAGRLAGGVLVLHALLSGFAAIDWIGSLAAEWYSSVFGLQIFVGQALSALAVAALASGLAAPSTQPGDLPLQGVRQDVGSLLLTLVVLFAYLAFANGYVIWSGNQPKAISWFEPRIQGGWRLLAFSLMALHFGVPFWALLFRKVKRNPAALFAVVILICAARILEQTWMVFPAAGTPSPALWALGLSLLVGLGCLWLAVFLWLSSRELPLEEP